MDLSSAKPDDVIRPECLESYKNFHQNIFGRLTHVNTSIRIYETISLYHYPLNHIYMHGTFWVMVYWNFLYSSIVLLNGLVKDPDSDALTLLKLKNLIRNKWLKDGNEIKESFSKKLKEARFSSEINEICTQIERMRHKVVAHRSYDVEQEQIHEIPGVSFPQLKKVLQSAEQLFAICSFGVECFTNLYWPSITEPEPKAEDVVKILDLVVKDSHWLNQPERHGVHWEGIRVHKDKHDIEELNKWRRKYGMTPA